MSPCAEISDITELASAAENVALAEVVAAQRTLSSSSEQPPLLLERPTCTCIIAAAIARQCQTKTNPSSVGKFQCREIINKHNNNNYWNHCKSIVHNLKA